MLFLNESTSYVGFGGSSAADKELTLMCESAGIPMGAFDQYFSSGRVGALEIINEANTAWWALEKDMMLCEAHSIIKGQPSILHEGLKDWWQAIKNFFLKIWNTIKGWFGKALSSVSSSAESAYAWYKDKKNEEALNKVGSTKAKISTYPNFKTGALDFSAFEDVTKFLQDPSGDTISEEEDKKKREKLDKDVDEEFSNVKMKVKIYGAENPSEQEYVKGDVDKILSNCLKLGATLKHYQDRMTMTAKDAVATAEAGEKEAQHPEDSTAKDKLRMLKLKVDFAKKRLSVQQAAAGLYVSGCNSMISTALQAAKELIRKYKEEEDKK